MDDKIPPTINVLVKRFIFILFKKRCKSTHLLRKQQEKLEFKFYSNFTWLRKLLEINLL